MFNLETALAAWRRSRSFNQAFDNYDMDELERHIRDHVSSLVQDGFSEKDAFDKALAAIGGYGAVEAEYEKVYWGKRRLKGEILHAIIWRASMFKNYLKIALRNLKQNLSYSFINILGLAVGVSCCLILLLYVHDELSYDRFHEDADAIYRVNIFVEQLGGEVGLTPTIVSPLLVREFPEVQAATRLEGNEGVIHVEEKVFDEDAFYFADSTFFSVFTHPLLLGDPRTALNRPYTVVLTASTAKKYFGDSNPVGKTLTRNSDKQYEVTGVMEDVPAQSHYQFDFLASFASREHWANYETWDSANFFTFLRLQKGTSKAYFEQKVDVLLSNLEARGDDVRQLVLQPLTDIHLRSDVAYDLDDTGDMTYIYSFATVALLVLLIACINYMNLATARSAKRAKEVGLRKTMGAFRGQLIWQFYGESALLVAGSLIVALVMVAASLPLFNSISGKSLSLAGLLAPEIGLLILGIFLIVSLVGGSYPAFYLSHFEPVRVLRGKIRTGRGASLLREGLVVLQFGISAVLIIGTLVVMNQLKFMRDQHLGFDKAHIVTVPLNDPVLRNQFPAMERALEQRSRVVAVAAVNQIPGQLGWTSSLQVPGKIAEEDEFLIKGMPVDAGVVDGLGLELIAGRAFHTNTPVPDSTSYQFLLNETTLRRLGWTPEEAVGQQISVNSRHGAVIGIVKDFHYRSLHEMIEPLAIWFWPAEANHLVIRLAPGDLRAGLADIKAVWTQFAPHRPFTYRFLDDVYNQLYQNEEKFGKMVAIFGFLAIFIACLGLFGLASYTAQQRTKEMGVRKVLGASAGAIVGLFLKEFLILVGIAFLVSIPVGYFAMGHWLGNFAYHIDITLQVFLVAGVLAFAIALLAVSYQSIKAAIADPVKSLRYE